MESPSKHGAAARRDQPTANFGLYDTRFYSYFSDLSFQAATLILTELAGFHPFRTVADFGCGSGSWLRACAKLIGDYPLEALLGIDGEHARKVVDPGVATFRFQNLEEPITLDRRYDLAMSLEVAEHLSPARAESFVADICKASDVVLFGAALPGQGGTNHLNEQWQDYWHAKFIARGFVCIDFIKDKFWNDPRMEKCPYYLSNTLLYVREGHPLAEAMGRWQVRETWRLRVVHPNTYLRHHTDGLTVLGALHTVRRKVKAWLMRVLKR